MGHDLLAPLEDVLDKAVQEFPKPPDWDDAEWSSLRERARHLLAKPIAPTQDLLAAIEPELLENNYTLQAFTWVPPDLPLAEPTDEPLSETMAAFHSDEMRAPLADGMVSRFFASKESARSSSLMVVFHPPGFGPWCVRGHFLADVNACDVWAPRLPEHGIVGGRGQPLQYQATVAIPEFKSKDWLEDLRDVPDVHNSATRSCALGALGSCRPSGECLGLDVSLRSSNFNRSRPVIILTTIGRPYLCSWFGVVSLEDSVFWSYSGISGLNLLDASHGPSNYVCLPTMNTKTLNERSRQSGW